MAEHYILWIAGVIINSIIAGLSILYFRYWYKPRIEIIFDRNVKSTLELLFSQINIFDSVFIHFCNYAEKEIERLPKDNRRYVNLYPPIESIIENGEDTHIIPNIKCYPEIEANRTRFDYGNKVLKEFLKMAIDQEKIICEHNLRGNKYLDHSFIHTTSVYLYISVYFMKEITQNHSYRSFLDSRLKHAKSIITKLKKDKLIPKTGSIYHFVDKWEKYIESEKNNSHA